MYGLVLLFQSMHGSIDVCDRNPLWLPRYSSYRPGARYDVPMVPRTRHVGVICQFKPYFHTLLALPTLAYLNRRADRSRSSDSIPGTPFSTGIPISPNASVTWSAPLVSCDELYPHS